MSKLRKSFSILITLVLTLSLAMVAVLWGVAEPVSAAESHVTTAAEFQAALLAAENNGENDTIYLAAGTYEGNFEYTPQDGMSLTITGEPGTSAENVALDGGGDGTVLRLTASSEGNGVIIDDITIRNGTESGLFVRCQNGSLDVSLIHMIIRNNSNEFGGGGIYLETCGNAAINVEIWDSIIRNNQSPGWETGTWGRGGGIYATANSGSSTTDLLIINSLIYGNQSNWSGGGISISDSNYGDNNVARALVINSTITGNVSNMHAGVGISGGGIRVRAYGTTASFDSYNTIVYGNTSLGGEPGQDLWVREAEPGNATVNAHNSDIGDVNADPGTYNPVDVINADPLFVDSASDNYHLTAASPCIDTGTINVPIPPGLPATDIEGNPRISGTAPDMGAYEWIGNGNQPPQLSNPRVEPATGTPTTDFHYYVYYFDPDGDSPTVKQIYIDDIAYPMELDSGTATDGTYHFGPWNLFIGEHDYFFYFEDGNGGTARSPVAGNYPEPVVNPVGPITVWNCPLGLVALISPYPANDRPLLTTAVELSQVTCDDTWFQVYYLDEDTGDVTFYDSFMGFGTLNWLQPWEFYYVVVFAPCNVYIPQ